MQLPVIAKQIYHPLIRTWDAKETVKTLFHRRIKVRIQAAKLDDVWPSEVPWAILKDPPELLGSLFSFVDGLFVGG